jgi:MFS family permease
VLGLSYVHQATSGFALPALLPMISPELGLSDFQGALLTSGYSYLYALALVPVGLLADKVRV